MCSGLPHQQMRGREPCRRHAPTPGKVWGSITHSAGATAAWGLRQGTNQHDGRAGWGLLGAWDSVAAAAGFHPPVGQSNSPCQLQQEWLLQAHAPQCLALCSIGLRVRLGARQGQRTSGEETPRLSLCASTRGTEFWLAMTC